MYGIRDFINASDAAAIALSFRWFLKAAHANSHYNDLPTEAKYYKLLYLCYVRIVFGPKGQRGCAGPDRCDIPPIPDTRCSVSRRTFEHRSDGALTVHYAASTWTDVRRNGCNM